jgi:hypothetical protein
MAHIYRYTVRYTSRGLIDLDHFMLMKLSVPMKAR